MKTFCSQCGGININICFLILSSFATFSAASVYKPIEYTILSFGFFFTYRKTVSFKRKRMKMGILMLKTMISFMQRFKKVKNECFKLDTQLLETSFECLFFTCFVFCSTSRIK